jgi:hypothetical protein
MPVPRSACAPPLQLLTAAGTPGLPALTGPVRGAQDTCGVEGGSTACFKYDCINLRAWFKISVL